MIRRLLIAGGGASFTIPTPTDLYCLFNGQNGDGVYAIGAATSTNGGGSWAEEAIPVLTKGSSGAWDDDHVKDPNVVWDGSQYVMYFAGHDGAKYQIGRATAPSWPPTWTKYVSNPVLAVGAGGAFDDAGVNFPTILYEPTDTGKEWKMWYGANDGSTIRIGYAHSSDGLSWTKVGQVLAPTGSGWEAASLLPMAIVKSGATYNLFYGGAKTTPPPHWQGGLVTFTDPEGTYTRFAGNPTLLARQNDSGTSQTFSANTSAGSPTVVVASTTAFHANEPVILTDGPVIPEVQRILTIDSGTNITLTTGTTSAFRSGAANLRPVSWNSVLARSILPAAGGYQMFGTPFQPVDDLGFVGTSLREMSFRWTSASLDGTWAYDYDTGILFPLYPTTTGWHKFSAENPSVIVAP